MSLFICQEHALQLDYFLFTGFISLLYPLQKNTLSMHRLKRANYGHVLKGTTAVFPCTL